MTKSPTARARPRANPAAALADVLSADSPYARARRAKEALQTRLGRPEWLLGVGLKVTRGRGYRIEVRVATAAAAARVPAEVQGVAVRTEVIARPHALHRCV